MSISKAQAEALAEGFLDDIGTNDKGEIRPKETYAEIIVLAGELIEEAQNNLIQGNNIASGDLSKSLVASEPTLNGNTFRVDILMNFYGRFINKGVKGTRSGSSRAGYSFKNEIVSKKMLSALQKYVDSGKIKTRTVKKYKPYGRHERKNRRLGKISEASAAFALAKSIKQKGIIPRGFLDKAIVTTQNKVATRLGAALKVDIINALNS